MNNALIRNAMKCESLFGDSSSLKQWVILQNPAKLSIDKQIHTHHIIIRELTKAHLSISLSTLVTQPELPPALGPIHRHSVQFSRSVVSDSLQPRELQHARPPCPSPTPGVHSNSSPSSWWCHPAISSSVSPFSSCPQSLPASESFPMSQLFAWEFQL